MSRHRATLAAVLTLATAAASLAGCHNTWEGVKADTKRALDKTGKGLQKAGDKIDSQGTRDGGAS